MLGDENKEEEKSEIDVSSAQLEDEKEAQDVRLNDPRRRKKASRSTGRRGPK